MDPQSLFAINCFFEPRINSRRGAILQFSVIPLCFIFDYRNMLFTFLCIADKYFYPGLIRAVSLLFPHISNLLLVQLKLHEQFVHFLFLLLS